MFTKGSTATDCSMDPGASVPPDVTGSRGHGTPAYLNTPRGCPGGGSSGRGWRKPKRAPENYGANISVIVYFSQNPHSYALAAQ